MAERRPNIPALTALGKTLFFDPALSASGKQSCASCHSPDHAYGPPNDLSVQLGGVDMSRTGVRAAPSLRYVQNVPAYTDHYHENDGNDAEDQGPTGGHNWDGRANSAHEQARIPLLSPHEMANGEPRVVVEKIRKGPHAETFRKVLGQDVLDDDETAFNAVLMALEVFQETPSEFYPYTSKYDAVLRGQAKLTPRRHAACASSTIRTRATAPRAIRAIFARAHFRLSRISDSSPWAPRNRKLAGNADPEFHDLGLCGPDRTDLKDRADYCGLFRTPSLRNVALRHAFFHNGVFHSLDEVLHFYAERDVKPQKWYPRGKDGKVWKFDDLPEPYQANVNMEAPFGGKPGDKPLMTEGEMRDVIAFLNTLTDGYKVPAAASVR
jgi:cytochrome c peroxidase